MSSAGVQERLRRTTYQVTASTAASMAATEISPANGCTKALMAGRYAIASETEDARSSSEKEFKMVGDSVPSPDTKAMPSRMMNATEKSRATFPRTVRTTVLKKVLFIVFPLKRF